MFRDKLNMVPLIALILAGLLMIGLYSYSHTMLASNIGANNTIILTEDYERNVTFTTQGYSGPFYVQFWNETIDDGAQITFDHDSLSGFEIDVSASNIQELSINLPVLFAEMKGEILEDGDNASAYEYRGYLANLNVPLIVNMAGGGPIETLVFVSVMPPDSVYVEIDGQLQEFSSDNWEYVNDNVITHVPAGVTQVIVYYEGDILVTDLPLFISVIQNLVFLILGFALLSIGLLLFFKEWGFFGPRHQGAILEYDEFVELHGSRRGKDGPRL